MKQGIHPRYVNSTVVCSTCGTTWQTRSTKGGNIRTELCSHCHPFYTGEQRIVDTAGQVDRFMKRMKLQKEKGSQPEATPVPAATAPETEAGQ